MLIYRLILRVLIFVFITGCTGCTRHHHLQGYIEGQLRYLSSSVSGYLENLPVTDGDQIRAGQVVFKLNPYPEKAELEQAQAQLQSAQENLANLIKGQRQTVLASIQAQRLQAQASLKYAEQTLQRNQALYNTRVIAKATLDESISQYKNSLQRVKELEANLAEAQLGARSDLIRAQEATVKAAQAEVDRFTWLLQQKIFYAPVNAQVVTTFFKRGEYIPASQPVLSILAAEDIKLIFYVPETILSQIKIGQTVFFNCDGCKNKNKARISAISPQAEYTPPVIYSRETRYKLVFRVEAIMDPALAVQFNPGQPVGVEI